MRILATALLCLAASVQAGDLPKGVLTLDGRPAPELRLADLDGEPYNLREHPGRWAFVHFWASWCSPCRREMPTIQRMAEHFVEAPFEIVLVNTAETEDAVFSFLGVVAPDLTTLMDSDGLVTDRWKPRGLPSTFLVDPAGKLRYLAMGDRPWDTPTYLDWLRRLTVSPE